MKIAIIGAGNVGSAIAHGVTRASRTVTLYATDPARAAEVAGEVGERTRPARPTRHTTPM